MTIYRYRFAIPKPSAKRLEHSRILHVREVDCGHVYPVMSTVIPAGRKTFQFELGEPLIPDDPDRALGEGLYHHEVVVQYSNTTGSRQEEHPVSPELVLPVRRFAVRIPPRIWQPTVEHAVTVGLTISKMSSDGELLDLVARYPLPKGADTFIFPFEPEFESDGDEVSYTFNLSCWQPAVDRGCWQLNEDMELIPMEVSSDPAGVCTLMPGRMIFNARTVIQSWYFPADDIPEEFFQFGHSTRYQSELVPDYELRAFPSVIYPDRQSIHLVNLDIGTTVASIFVGEHDLIQFKIVYTGDMPPGWRAAHGITDGPHFLSGKEVEL